MKISVLGSGSSGNCSYIEIAGKKILVDVGYSMKKINDKLSTVGKTLNDIDAIFITHDHGDHIKSFGAISRKYDIDLYIHPKSLNEVRHKLGKLDETKIKLLTDKRIFLDNIMVENFEVMHDSANNLGYSFMYRNKKLSYVTDIGKITNIVKEACRDSDILAFESNYDLNLLLNGEYPWTLKNRVKGNRGHISNEEASKLIASIADNRMRKIILLHLSSENNHPELALRELKELIGSNKDIEVSSQEPTKIYELIK